MEKVSIITVCLNSEKTIEQTIRSVIKQTYSNIEYIIIDGCSTDGTLDIIRQYEDRIAYWISEKDNGLYDAINKGLRVATGSIVGIIDSNDWYSIDAVESAVGFFQRNDIDLLYGDVVYIGMNGEYNFVQGDRMKDYGICQWYYFPTVFAKIKLYRNYGMFDVQYRIYADMEWMLRMNFHGVTCGYLKHVMAYFRTDGISSVPQTTYEKLRETRKIFSEMAGKYLDRIKEYKKISEVCTEVCASLRYKGIEYRMIKYQTLVHQMEEFLQVRSKKKYVIWGTGEALNGILYLFDGRKNLLRSLVDTNIYKQSEFIDGVKIISPKELLDEDFIIVSSMKYYHDIKLSLENVGRLEGMDFLSQDDFRTELVRQYAKYISGSQRGNEK